MTPFHRQTQNMSDLTSDRVPLFWTQKIGGITRIGSQSQDIPVVMPTIREAQFVQLWTKPDTKGITRLYEWCFLFLDNLGFPFLAKAIVAYLTRQYVYVQSLWGSLVQCGTNTQHSSSICKNNSHRIVCCPQWNVCSAVTSVLLLQLSSGRLLGWS